MFNDIISSDITVVGESQFTVDTAVDQVTAVPPGPAGLKFLNGNGNAWFAEGDSVLLVGAFIVNPYGFGQGTGKSYLGIAWVDGVGGFTPIPELAGNSILVLPGLCDLSFPPNGLYIRCPTGAGRQALCLTNMVMNVSQINAPPQLQGDVLKIQVHLQVNHTKIMVVAA